MATNNKHEMKFKMRRYPEGLSSLTSIHVTRTANGWFFDGQAHEWRTGPDGCQAGIPADEAGICDLLRREEVVYPAQLPDAFRWLWELASEGRLSDDQLGSELQRIADWVTACEMNAPVGGAFAGCFSA